MSKQTSTKVKEDIRTASANGTNRIQAVICCNRNPVPIYVDKILGYCHFGGSHSGVVTRNILKTHDCLKKNCYFLERYDLPGWIPIEEEIERKRKKKEQVKQSIEAKKQLNADMLAAAVAFIEYFDLPIAITGIRQITRPVSPDRKVQDGRKYSVYYIADTENYHLHDETGLRLYLANLFGYFFTTRQVTLPNGHNATFDNIPDVTRDHIRETYQLASMGTFPKPIRKLIDRDLENKAKISEVMENQDAEQFLTPELLEWFDADHAIKEIDNPKRSENKLSCWLRKMLFGLFKRKG